MNKKKTQSVRLDIKVDKKLTKYCKENGIKKAWFFSKAVEEKLDAILGVNEQWQLI